MADSAAFLASSVELNNAEHDENCSRAILSYPKEQVCVLFGSDYILEGLTPHKLQE